MRPVRHPRPWVWSTSAGQRSLIDSEGAVVVTIAIGAGSELRRRVHNIVSGSGRPAARLPRRACPESHARVIWRAAVAEALADRRMTQPRGPVMQNSTAELARSLIAETIRLRIQDCYRPLFRTMANVERDVIAFGQNYTEAWAPPSNTLAMEPMAEHERPVFLSAQQPDPLR